jgi:hypothetical protein
LRFAGRLREVPKDQYTQNTTQHTLMIAQYGAGMWLWSLLFVGCPSRAYTAARLRELPWIPKIQTGLPSYQVAALVALVCGNLRTVFYFWLVSGAKYARSALRRLSQAWFSS